MLPSSVAVLMFLCTVLASAEPDTAVNDLQPAGAPFFTFSDGFEGATRMRDVFPLDASRWHGITLEPNHADRKAQSESSIDPVPSTDRNAVALSTAHPRSGRLALKAHAGPYQGSVASKADVSRTQLAFRKGDTVTSTVWYFIESGSDITDLFIWDIEAESTEARYAGQPGRRLYFQSGEVLASDLGKWLPTPPRFRQKPNAERPFPRDCWVRVDVRMYLSEADDGSMQVWQDGHLIISAKGQTLPEAASVYTSLEVGITANGNVRHAQTLYADDVELRAWRGAKAHN